MQELILGYEQSGNLHHAYLLEGEHEVLVPAITSFIESRLKISTRGNPDVLVLQYNSFGIDEGRYLQGLESLHATAGTRKIFIIAFHFITREAQNAFLKLFEEPLPGTHFFLVTPSAHMLLPTLRSRLHIIAVAHSAKKEGALAEKFLKTVPAKRVELFKKILDAKDKPALLVFLNDLEAQLYQDINFTKAPETRMFEEIQKVRRYLYDTGPLLKMLLEHLSLLVPVR